MVYDCDICGQKFYADDKNHMYPLHISNEHGDIETVMCPNCAKKVREFVEELKNEDV